MFPVVSDALAALAAFLCLRRGVSIPARPFLVPGVTFLCLRRGVSGRECRRSYHRHFSLPTQRCFRFEIRNIEIQSLFSAYAEVFLSSARWTTPCLTFLCLRRGVSEFGAPLMRRQTFSLPTQRCFSVSPRVSVIDWLFSAYAEVFPPARVPRSLTQPFLCLRRGVSFLSEKFGSYHDFSLPTQRCFQRLLRLPDPWRLFSAYAEVFPPPKSLGRSPRTFLCLRRGVSYITEPAEQIDGHTFLCLRRGVSRLRSRLRFYAAFSLPTQRCFHTSYSQPLHQFLFSAYAEVFSLAK